MRKRERTILVTDIQGSGVVSVVHNFPSLVVNVPQQQRIDMTNQPVEERLELFANPKAFNRLGRKRTQDNKNDKKDK